MASYIVIGLLKFFTFLFSRGFFVITSEVNCVILRGTKPSLLSPNQPLMKLKIAILILVFGYVLEFIGAWFKITHQAPADLTLAASAFFKVTGLLLFTFLLLAHPRVKAFLEYDKFRDSFK
jgi:hypothetical protein